MNQGLFLDRDGVINKVILRYGQPFSVRRFDEFELVEGVREVLEAFRKEGFINIIVTNQPDIARGLMKKEELEKMHVLIREELPVDDILVCPHDDNDNCNCRKPKSGLLLKAAKERNIDLKSSFVIGDQWKDMEAGKNAGCTTVLIDYPYNKEVKADFRVKDLSSAEEIILKGEKKGNIMDEFVNRYFREIKNIVEKIDVSKIEQMITLLVELRERNGRLFFLGVGGGAANASHAVNDCRKIAGIEAYTPTDNVAELTARVNDDGWENSFANWLAGCRLKKDDAVFIFSVGGGNEEKNISVNIVNALKYAREKGAKIFGIVGRDGGYTKQVADACVIIPAISADTVTAHTESFQAVIWHLIVSHPKMKISEMKWESIR
jgi:D-sedoheptulose 7-phosphate isomerase